MLKTSNNIAQTGLRTLFVLQLLIKGPISKNDIIEKIAQNPYLKNVAQDTITLDINTLKAAGFDIKTGNKSNGYCYELKLNPIKIKLSKSEIQAINITKKAMFDFMDFRYIVNIYSTFEKIVKFIFSKEDALSILNFGNFLKVDFTLLKELDVHCKHKNEIEILYQSPKNPNEVLPVKCIELKYSKKNDKMYLWCEADKYEGVLYLRADRIRKIVKILKFNNELKLNQKTVCYAIKRAQTSPLVLEDYEKIIKITANYILIRANYLNKFNLIQRLVSFGEDLIFVDSDEIKEELKSFVQEIEEMYN